MNRQSDKPSDMMDAAEAKDQQMQKTWKPIVAGVLNIVCSIIHFFFIASFLSCVSNFTGRPPDAYALSIAIVAALFVCLEYTGGIYALARKRWGLALAGSIVATSFLWPLGIPAIVFTVLSKNEFN